MRPLDWWYSYHPDLSYFANQVAHALEKGAVRSLDALTIDARLPVRTTLLTLDVLETRGKLRSNLITNELSQEPEGWRGNWGNCCDHKLSERERSVADSYFSLVQHREEPALLWGQRRLLPESSLQRAMYILSCTIGKTGRVVFLGDDDLVSPLVSVLSGLRVDVLDIDRAVLEKASAVATALGGTVFTHQVNIADSARPAVPLEVDVVVCDPFPSADGAFESMFWSRACEMLRDEGVLVTTVAPSHKPLAFSAGAIGLLQGMGFMLRDLRADFGKYETFPFEFTDHEWQIISKWNLHSRVSHTKSILSAVWRKRADLSIPRFDFAAWLESSAYHYLTQQAGLNKQFDIARERGLGMGGGGLPDRGDQSMNCERLHRLLPPHVRSHVEVTESCPDRLVAQLEREFGLEFSSHEAEEFREFSQNRQWQPKTKLGLAMRAIESWGRSLS